MNRTVMIRLATPEDAAEILKIYAPYVVNTAISFEYEVPSEEEFRGRVESTLNSISAICMPALPIQSMRTNI